MVGKGSMAHARHVEAAIKLGVLANHVEVALGA